MAGVKVGSMSMLFSELTCLYEFDRCFCDVAFVDVCGIIVVMDDVEHDGEMFSVL
jgi:hypothetical protein